VQAKAAERRAAEDLRSAVTTYGLPVDISPGDALLAEVHRTAGHVAWLEQRVRALDPDALVWGTVKTRHGHTAQGEVGFTEEAAQVAAVLQLYQAERKHLVDVCRAALSAGVEERRVQLAEQQGVMLAGVIRAVLGDLDLSPEQQARVSEVVPRHLRAVNSSVEGA